MCCLAHRAPLSPRQAEAEGPPCQRPGTSLNPHSASTTSLSPRQHIWLFLPLPWSLRGQILIPLLLPLWGIWVQPRVGGRPAHPLPPRILASGPPAQLLPAKNETFGLYLRSHAPCAVSRLPHLFPALQLVYLSPWAASLGAPHSQVPLWCHVRHFARKSHLRKDGKDKK